jgi:4-alpha-glucanotransferase
VRRSGLLLHVTSLPSPGGIGDLGRGALEFADFLHAAGQRLWQMLPLNPTGYGDSPYQSFSAFAGNFLLLSLDDLRDQGLLAARDLEAGDFPAGTVDFERVIPHKTALLRRAAAEFFSHASAADRRAFDAFCQTHASWLDDFALFMAAKEARRLVAWTEWEAPLRRRDPAALARERDLRAADIAVHNFWQFEFFRQWERLRAACRERQIALMGDIPIYVAHDSADVWSRQEMFQLQPDGRPSVVSGVPPDYFSSTGQLWGNPIYRWDVLRDEDYRWWVERVRAAFAAFDLVRIDHFRGLEAYWEVPGGETTAIRGRWVKGPGAGLFRALQRELGALPIVAENLGVITPEVEALRHEFRFPGMAILQFAFGIDEQAPTFRPHNYVRDLVAYTGTHDNDPAVGWWTSSGAADSVRTPEDVRREHEFAAAYLRLGPDEEINWALIRTVIASVADTVIIPVQDLLGLGSDARMNLPGRLQGNWRWRCPPGALTPALAARLKTLAALYERS